MSQGQRRPTAIPGHISFIYCLVFSKSICVIGLWDEFAVFNTMTEQHVGLEEVRYTSREEPKDEHRCSGRPAQLPVTTSFSKQETSSSSCQQNQSKIQFLTNSTRPHHVLKGQQLMWYNSQKNVCFKDQTQRRLPHCSVSPHRQVCPLPCSQGNNNLLGSCQRFLKH